MQRTYIINPLYDAAFKFLMDDNLSAQYMLSALLKKEVVAVTMLNRELPSEHEDNQKIKLYRLDFAAVVQLEDGTQQKVLIEIQKTSANTEIHRFRKYLGLQYINEDNLVKSHNGKNRYALPMITIYILGHQLDDLSQPVTYVNRGYFDYEDNAVSEKSAFVESLSHDTIIVQVPLLDSKNATRVDRLLLLFDQTRRAYSAQVLELSFSEEELSANPKIKTIIDRLSRALNKPDLVLRMDLEDQVLYDLENKDLEIMEMKSKLEEQAQRLGEKEHQLEEQNQQLEEQNQQLEEQKQKIAAQQSTLKGVVLNLASNGHDLSKIAELTGLTEEEVRVIVAGYR